MTITGIIEEHIELPEGVSAERKGPWVKVSGPNGEITKRLHHPRVDIQVGAGEIRVSSRMPRTREKSLVGTFAAHIRNMVQGVQEDYECRLKIVYSHFPMKVNVRGNRFVIENFMGERGPRSTPIPEGVKVDVKGSDVTVTGANLETVGQTAANIERATRIRGYDPRVFQDGIYIVEKARREHA
ncbi:MAG: 50S ribosomal protein L6 [Methanomassiliicoccales archaeon]